MENEAPTVASLIIIRRNGKDSSHPRELTVEDEEMVVGRTDDCDLCIKLPVVSRKQATFRLCKFSSPDHAINSDDPAPSSDALGVYVIANFGTTNPTKINDKAVGPPGREYVMRHKDIITVADRKFRLEYVGGVTPSGADSVQQTLDREWLQKKKVQQTQPAKQGKDQPGGNCTENSHPNNNNNNNTDATQDLSKFVRAASGSRKGGLGDKTKTFGQRLETVAENKATHHPKPPSKHDMTKTPAKKDIGAAVKARPPVASSEEKKPAVQSGDETSAEKEGKAKGNNCSPAMSIDSFANNVATPGGGNNDLVEFSGGVDNENEAGAVPSISSQPILTFTPDEPSSPEEFSSFPQRGNSISSAVNYESNIQESSLADVEITATFNQEATSGEDTSTPIDVKLPAKALDTPMKESIAQVASNMAENRSTLPSKALPTPAKQGIANAAATMAENRDDKLPPKALPTPLKVDITIAAPDMLFNRIKTMPLSSLPTPMKTNISQAATEMAENRAEMTSSTLPTPMKATIAQAANAMAEGRAEVPSSALPTPMKATIAQAANAMAEGRAEVPSSALPTPMKASISQVASAMAEVRAKVPSSSLPTPMKAGISQVASEMAGNRSQVPSSALPMPMKATIAQAANAMAEGRAEVPSSALPTPMKVGISQVASAMAEGRAEVPSSALPTPMKAGISQVASEMAGNRSQVPSSALPTPMKATIAQAANAMAEGRAEVPSSALPTPMKAGISQVASAMAEGRAEVPSSSLPTPMKAGISQVASEMAGNRSQVPSSALPTPMKAIIAQAANAMAEGRAEVPSSALPTPMKAGISQVASEMAGNRAEVPSSALSTPMKAGISQVASAMAEGRAEVPSSSLPTPMKAGISQVASEMAGNRSQVPSSSLPTPMKAIIAQAANAMAEGRAEVPSSALPTPMKAGISQVASAMVENRSVMPTSSLPTPMKAGISQAANAMAEGRAEVPSSALPTPMKAGISQVASAMVENRSVMPTSSLPTPMKAGISQAANAMAEGRAEVPSSALPTPMKTNIASAAAAMSKALANKLPLKALPTPIKTNIASTAAVVGKNLADKLPPKALPTPAKESIAGAAMAFTERQAKKTDEHLPIESVANTGENVEEASGVIENSTMASGVMEAEEVEDVFVSVGGQQSAIENNASEGAFEGAETASEVVNASSSTEAVDMSVDDPTHPEEAHSAVEKSEMPMDEPVTEEESSLAEVEAPLAEEEPVALQERLIETNKEEVEQGTDDEWEIVDADSIRNETKTLSAKDTEQLRTNDKLQEESVETVGGDAEPEGGTAGAAEEAVLDEMESEDAIELPPDAIEDTTTECKDIDMNLPTDEEVVGKCTVDQPSPEESSATMDNEEAIIKSAAEDDDVKASIDDAVFGKQDDVQETVDNVEVKEPARESTEEEVEEKEATATPAGDDDVTDERAEVEADDEGVALDENKVDPITTPGTNGIEKTEPPVQEDVQEEEGENYGLTPELIAGLNYNELRSTCKDHGLPANGKAHDLKERLLQLCSSSQGNMEEECEVEEKKADEVEDEVEEKKVEQVDGKRDDGNDEAMETEETPYKSSEDAQEVDSGLTPEFIAGLNYNELRSTCKDHGLPANGKTGDLKARLLQLVRSDKETMETDESSTSLGTSKRSYEKQAEGEPDSKRQKVDEKEGEDSGLTPEVIAGLKYTELRSTCKAHGLPANGKTADLKARLLSLVSS